MSYGKNILKYKDDILKDLETLISIESVDIFNRDECEEALNFVLNKGKEFNLDTKNIKNTAGHVQLGNKGKLCGVLTHLDVVPSGNNWRTLPFELTRKNGRLYGRGVADNKGAAIIALYCLKVLMEDNSLKGKNTLRAIYGTAEETGMTDMDIYFKEESMPDIAFTPDSNYGICNREKGILQLELYAKTHTGTTLTEFHSGKAVNAVPDTAYALLDCSENEDHQLLRLADASDGNFDFHYTIDGLMILSKGKAAHASSPEKGFNAATALVDLLGANFSYNTLGSIVAFLNNKINSETDGTSMGVKTRDKESGPLTVNIGTVHVYETYATLTMDIRYPVTADGDKILEQVEKLAKDDDLTVKVLSHLKPINLNKDTPIIKTLSKSYKNIMGKKPNLYCTGGGTYSRKLNGNCVAFGPVFPDDNCNIHNSNESINEENLFKHAEICLETLYNFYIDNI